MMNIYKDVLALNMAWTFMMRRRLLSYNLTYTSFNYLIIFLFMFVTLPLPLRELCPQSSSIS